jgi:hypothetical protein
MANPNLSTHIPGLSRGVTEVVGELQVDSGLKTIRAVTITFNESNLVANEESKLSWYRLADALPGYFVIRVEKGGSNEGVLGTNSVKVSWIAEGE